MLMITNVGQIAFTVLQYIPGIVFAGMFTYVFFFDGGIDPPPNIQIHIIYTYMY